MEPSRIEDLRHLADAIGPVVSEKFPEFPALVRLVELAGELAHEGREPVSTTVVNSGPDIRPLTAFAVRVAGAAGWFRTYDEAGQPIPEQIKRGIHELGMALQLLEAGQ